MLHRLATNEGNQLAIKACGDLNRSIQIENEMNNLQVRAKQLAEALQQMMAKV